MMFTDIDLFIDSDSRVVLVGGNGQGKTTLLNLMVGQLEATKGYIKRNPRMRVAKFAQHHVDQLDLEQSPVEYLSSHFPV